MIIEDLKLINYEDGWHYQQKLFEEAIATKNNGDSVENRLLLCEHSHTITLGKHGDKHNLLYNTDYLNSNGVSLFEIERGGDVTYHGPGQLVVYPIFDLEYYGIGLRQYIYNLEEIVIRFLKAYGIEAQRLKGAAGVWLDVDISAKTRKIAAIGVRCSRYITMHGLALNINTDLSYFSLINPCGFTDKGVSSVKQELATQVDMSLAKQQIVSLFEKLFPA